MKKVLLITVCFIISLNLKAQEKFINDVFVKNVIVDSSDALKWKEVTDIKPLIKITKFLGAKINNDNLNDKCEIHYFLYAETEFLLSTISVQITGNEYLQYKQKGNNYIFSVLSEKLSLKIK